MEMSAALQVALFLASLAIIALVACLVPIAFSVWRRLERLSLTAEQLKANVDGLVHDSREMVRSVNGLATRANQQMDEAAEVVQTVQQWTKRADRLVNEVGAAIEPPVFSLLRNMNLLRTGATTFLQALFHNKQNNNQAKQEKHHV
jgi:uncharacterized protein YoxC